MSVFSRGRRPEKTKEYIFMRCAWCKVMYAFLIEEIDLNLPCHVCNAEFRTFEMVGSDVILSVGIEKVS